MNYSAILQNRRIDDTLLFARIGEYEHSNPAPERARFWAGILAYLSLEGEFENVVEGAILMQGAAAGL